MSDYHYTPTLRQVIPDRLEVEGGADIKYVIIPEGREWGNNSARLYVERDRAEVIWFVTEWGWTKNQHGFPQQGLVENSYRYDVSEILDLRDIDSICRELLTVLCKEGDSQHLRAAAYTYAYEALSYPGRVGYRVKPLFYVPPNSAAQA
jgi:hypothetical protein